MTDSANSSPYQAWTGDGEQLSASPLLFEYRSGTIQQDELPLTGIAEIGATAADATALEALSVAVGRKRVGQLSYREVASRLQPCSRQVAVASDGSVAYLLHTRLLSTLSQSTDGTMSLKETFYGEISRENSEVRGTESVHEGDLSPQFSCHLDSSLTERPELRKLCWSKECRHILVLGELCQQIFIYSKDCRLLALISVPLIRGLRAAFDLDQNWELRCVDILPNTGCSSDNHELESQRAVTFFCVFNDVFVQAVTIPEKNLSGDSSHPKTLQLLDIHTQVVYSQQNSRQRTPIPLLTDRSVEAIHWFTEELQDKSAVQWVVIIAVDAAKKVLAGGDQFAFLTMFRCHGAVTDAVVWEEFFTATVERKKLPTTMSNSLEASNAYRQNSMLGVVGAAAVSRFGSMLGLNLGGPGSGQSSGKYFAPIIQICTSPDNR